MPYQPAVLGPNTRLNNFRLNYLTAAQAADRPTHIRILLGGIDITQPGAVPRVIYKSMTIRDLVFEAPNTCALTLYGAAPTVGQALEVWLNSNDPKLLFGGELQTVGRTYAGRPTTVLYPCTAIDDTARANRKRPLGLFTNVSATTIAQTLIATYCPGYSSAGVELDLPPVTVNFDGSEGGLKGCLTQVAKLIGGYWYFEQKTLYLFRTPPGIPPQEINDAPGRFLDDPAIVWTMDKSQVRTRVYGKGASTQIVTTIDAGTTLVPVREATMFNPGGGRAILGVSPDGAASRVVTYTGVQLQGGGGLVGPGASPSAVPGLVLLDGAGIESGVHKYAYSFTTAAGESLPSPAAAITVGPLAPPSVAPTPGAPTAGGSVDAGTHYYGVTFVTATGETPSPAVTNSATTTVGAGVAPPGTTTAALRHVAGNLAAGVSYQYKTTVTVSGGETLPGAAGSAITPTIPTGPAFVAQTVDYESGGQLIVDQVYVYALSFLVGGYESAIGPQLVVDLPPDPLLTRIVLGYVATSADARITGRKLYRFSAGQWRLVATIPDNLPNLFYRDGASDASLGPARGGEGAIGTPPGDQATITVPTSSDPRAVGRKVYRSDNGAAYRYLTTISNNTTPTTIDNTASVAANAPVPSTDTSGGASYQTVPLTGIVTGPANVTARRLYRYSAGGPYKLLATIANNTQTTYTDTQPNSALGVTLPTVNTANANNVQVSFAIGGAAVTGRKIYRSKANLDPLLLAYTIANNTTSVITDNNADAGLTTPAPTVDTSGLTQPSGQVPAGAYSMVVANTSAFATTPGGWAVVGNGEQVIRYLDKTATGLQGIPATGPGSLVAAVSYNSTITAAPALVGVAGLVEGVLRGSPIHVWVQRDDPAAQAAMAALDGGGDGVYEHIVSDERRSEPSLIQVCDAELALYGRPLVTVTYGTRDQQTKSGKTIIILLTTPAIGYTRLTIQEATISEIGIRGLSPKFTVTASSVQHSFEAILQKLIRNAGM